MLLEKNQDGYFPRIIANNAIMQIKIADASISGVLLTTNTVSITRSTLKLPVG